MNAAINFVVSGVGEDVSEDALHQVKCAIEAYLEVSEVSLRKMSDSQDFLLTLNSSLVENLETTVMECFELEGHLVTAIQVKLDSVIAMKLENKIDIDELMVELQLKDVFKDESGATKDIKALVGNKNLSMVLVILHTHIGDILNSDLSAVGGLVAVYKAKSEEFLELFFGKSGIVENHLEKIWSYRDSGRTHEVLDAVYDAQAVGTKLESRRETTIQGKEESKTINVIGEYASEKCILLQKLCQDLTVGDCMVTVNSDSKVITVTGNNGQAFQKCINIIEKQIKLFHCEEIKNVSRKSFNLLIQNENMKRHFSSILSENHVDSVVLFEDNFNRPTVLGSNEIKTRKFIGWLEKFFAKESITFCHSHNKLGCKKLESSLDMMAVNLWVSVDVTMDDKIIVEGLAADVFSLVPRVKNFIPNFRHIRVGQESLNYINEYGIDGLACQALPEENCVCLFQEKESDEGHVRMNPMKRTTLYAPPVLYNILVETLKNVPSTIEKMNMTEIHYDYSSYAELGHLKGILLSTRNKYQISIFHGQFDWQKILAILAEKDLVYETNPKDRTITVFCEKDIVCDLKSILQDCLKNREDTLTDHEYHLQSHSFKMGLQFQTENRCGEFGIPKMCYDILPVPSRCRIS